MTDDEAEGKVRHDVGIVAEPEHRDRDPSAESRITCAWRPKGVHALQPQGRIVAAEISRHRRQRGPEAVAGDPQRPRLSRLFGLEVRECLGPDLAEAGKKPGVNEVAVCIRDRQKLSVYGEIEHCRPEIVHLRAAKGEHDRIGHRRDVRLCAVRAVEVRYVVGDPRVLERRLHCRFVRVSQKGGIGQPPRVAQIQRGVERLERMLPDALEERIRLRDVRWRIQDTGSLSRQWFLHSRTCLLRVNDISTSWFWRGGPPNVHHSLVSSSPAAFQVNRLLSHLSGLAVFGVRPRVIRALVVCLRS